MGPATPTSLPPPGAEDVVYVIDLSGYVFRAYHAIGTPLASPMTGEPTHATLGTVTMVQRLVTERKPTHLIVAMDSRGPSFRKELYPAYKATRPPPPEDLSIQMRRCREITEAYAMPVAQLDGVEADDIIATIVRDARAAKMRVVVVTSDKDLMQLVGDDVVLWDTMRNKVFGPPEVEEKLGVPPSQVRDYLALTGDTSDNIPGVPSVGPKTAADLLHQFGSLDGVFAGVEEVARKKLKETLIAHEADARMSQRLVSLKEDVALGLDVRTSRPGPPDLPRLRALFGELGFTRLLGLVGGDTSSAAQGALPRSAAARPRPAPPPPPPDVTTWTHAVAGSAADVASFAERAASSEAVAIRALGTSPHATRGHLVGLALALPGETLYVPIAHRRLDGPPMVPLDAAVKALRPLLGADAAGETTIIGHDVKHDEVLLRRHGLTLRRVSFDVMLAAYLLDPEADNALSAIAQGELGEPVPSVEELLKKGRGASIEVDQVAVEEAARAVALAAAACVRLTRRLAPRLEAEGMAKVLADVELPLSRSLAELELAGVRVDVKALASIGTMVDAKLVELEEKAHAIAGRPFNVGSPRQLETLLFDELKLKVIKRTKTSRSTDAEVLEALAESHPLPGVILDHRQLAKLKGTYIEALPQLVDPKTGRIHTTFAQAVAATGRISSNDPNLQNIPIRTEIGRAIRGAFVPEKGHVILSADYSQIELRVLADLSKDPVLIDAFTTGQDIHARTAMEVFDKTEDQVGADERRAAKTINFGVIYGMGDSALAKRLGISRKEAAGFIEAYFRRYAGVRAFFDQVIRDARASESVTTMAGRRRYLRDISSANRGLRLAAERIAQNTPIQGSAADILKLAMVALSAPVVPGARMILTVHDELVFEVPVGKEELVGKKVKAAMEGVVSLAVPLVVDVGWGDTWAAAHG